MYCRYCGGEHADGASYCSHCGRATTEEKVRTSRSPDETTAAPGNTHKLPYAHSGRRVVAYVLDIVFVVLIAMIIGFICGLLAPAVFVDERGPSQGIGLLVSVLYFTLTESSSWQATPGKRILGIKVTDLAGVRISFLHALGRYLARLLCVLTLSIGYIAIVASRRRKGFHDMAARTLVTRADAAPAAISQAGFAPRRFGLAIVLFLISPFTLGVIAAIAIPQYQHYVERTKIAQAAARSGPSSGAANLNKQAVETSH